MFPVNSAILKNKQGSPSAPEAHEADFRAEALGNGPCSGLPRSGLRLRIVAAAPRGLNKHTLGYASPCAAFGIDATIFRDRIETAAQNVVPFMPRILGHAMAHELGHVLLRSAEHPATGLMRRRWTQSDWERVMTSMLPFTPQESERIRQEVVRVSRAR